MKRVIKIFLCGIIVLMTLQLSAISVSAACGEEVVQETVSAQTYKAVTATSGDFGVNNGLHWYYDTETRTVTITGEDEPDVSVIWDNEYQRSYNSVFPENTEHIIFSDCILHRNMSFLFSWLTKLETIDFSGLMVKDLNSLSCTFSGCQSLKELDLSWLDTGNVIDMDYMFRGCSSLISLDLSSFDTGKVSSIYLMFFGCSSLKTLDISNFNTQGIDFLEAVFAGCSSLERLDLSSFDTTNVICMSELFSECSSLTELVLGDFDTSNVNSMYRMFYGCSSLKNLDLSGFHTEKVVTMTQMFEGCKNLTDLDISSFDTSNVTDILRMFYGCSSLKNLDLSGFHTGNITSMSGMFQDCGSLTTLDVSGFDTSKVTDMGWMFSGCSGLKNLDVSGFDTRNVANMVQLFYECSGLENLDVSRFDTCNVTDMTNMFYGCSSLTGLDVSGFDTSNVTDMGQMFFGCSNLENLDVSSFDTGNVKDMYLMFFGCYGLKNLDLSNFDTANVTEMSWMFFECKNLATLNTPAKMGDAETVLPDTFYTEDGVSTTVLSKDFAGMILYREGHQPVRTPLKIVGGAYSVGVEEGSHAFFSISATGDGLTYQWQLCYAGETIFRKCTFTGADTEYLVVDATKARNGYQFRCVVTDKYGDSVTSEVCTLTVKDKVPLGVALTASKTTADSGEIVTFTAVGNGGDGNYQYKFIINDTTNDKWYKLQDYSANNTIEWKATTAGTKRIMVDIKDGTGKSVGKNVSVVVNGTVAPAELKGTLTASSYEVNPGDVVTLTAQALGGSGKYNYKFIINDKTDDKWYRLQDYGTNSVIQWTATTPGTKRLMVDVMDSNGRKFGTNVTITVK